MTSASSSRGPVPPRAGLPAGYLAQSFTIGAYDEAIALWRASDGIGLNESDTREAIATFLDRNPGLSLVVRDPAGVLVAAVLCGHDGRRGYLHHLAVAAAHQRRGIGRAIVETCLGRLADQGIAKCNLFLYADNAAGRAFWLRHGWRTRDDLIVVQRATPESATRQS